MEFVRQKHTFSSSIKTRLIALRALDNWHGFVALGYDYAVIALAALLFLWNAWFYPISLILIGSRQRALATLLHESAHRCLAKSKWINQFIGTYLSGYLILQEYNIYIDTHVRQHHGYLGNEEKDPDLQYHQAEGLYQPMNQKAFLYQFILKPLLLLQSPSYVIYLIKNRLNPNQKYRRQFMVMCVYWMLIVAVCCYAHVMNLLILLWFVPLMTTSAVFGWFNELSEHYPLSPEKKLDLELSRNRFSHWFEHFLFNTHNEHFHLIHHLYPTIPFWNLSKAHSILLEDETYRARNETAGGIFWSNNKNPSLMRLLLARLPLRSSEEPLHE